MVLNERGWLVLTSFLTAWSVAERSASASTIWDTRLIDLAASAWGVQASTTNLRAASLPTTRTGHALTDPITLVASFYALVERTAASRGINPDTPRHLKKVTETI